MPPRLKTTIRWFARGISAVVLTGALYVAWDQAHYNLGEVQPGRILRSGQMPAAALARTIRDRGIKTVLNLRGENKDDWYKEERKATLGAGATQVDLAMSSCMWLSRDRMRAVVRTLDTAEYPILVHCQWGSERTGLVSAIAELLRPGGSIESARAQFSISYLFARVGDGKVMAEHLDQYERWLSEKGRSHEPALFREWVAAGYRPGSPSSEDWPRDPYPLVVTTRPDGRTTR